MRDQRGHQPDSVALVQREMECGRSLLARIAYIVIFGLPRLTTPPQRWEHVARLVRSN